MTEAGDEEPVLSDLDLGQIAEWLERAQDGHFDRQLVDLASAHRWEPQVAAGGGVCHLRDDLDERCARRDRADAAAERAAVVMERDEHPALRPQDRLLGEVVERRGERPPLTDGVNQRRSREREQPPAFREVDEEASSTTRRSRSIMRVIPPMTQLGFSFEVVAPPPARQLPAIPRSGRSARAVQLSLLEKIAAPRVEPRPGPEPERPSLKEQTRLERSLRAQIGPQVMVSLTSNTSTMISFRRRGRALYVRVHKMFANAPEDVLSALASFVTKDETTKKEAALLDDWIEKNRPALNADRARALQARPIGEIHDLVAIFERLNGRYFDRKVDAQITWGRAARKQRRTTIHMGTYSHELKLIRIHPALDQPFVPTYFVEFVVFHEMLHQVHDIKETGGCRREVHGPAFRADEKRFERYREARDWERLNLKRLLRY
jgi:hypothetical protein